MFSKDRYDEVGGEMKNMLIKVGWKKDFVGASVPVFPISGWMGDNLLVKSENMAWWSGVDIVDVDKKKFHLEKLLDALNDFCAPAGRVEQGIVEPNTEVIFMPTHTPANACAGKVFT